LNQRLLESWATCTILAHRNSFRINTYEKQGGALWAAALARKNQLHVKKGKAVILMALDADA